MAELLSSDDFYSSVADDYESISNERRKYLDAVDNEILSWASSLGNIRLLDVGTGNGFRLANLIDRLSGLGTPLMCKAVEPSRGMRDLASAKLRGRCEVHSEWDQFPSDEGFSLVLALWNVVGHADSADLLREVRSRLTPEGIFLFDCNLRYNGRAYGWKAAVRNFVADWVRLQPGRITFFPVQKGDSSTLVGLRTRRSIARELSSAGLVVVAISYFDYSTGERRANQWKGQAFVACKRA